MGKTVPKGKPAILAMLLLALAILPACQFRPMYGSTGGQALSGVSVADVDTREGQQVRNHLIFLLTGGTTPASPNQEVRLRVSSTVQGLADVSRNPVTNQVGNSAGAVTITASYDIYDFATKTITHSGRRSAQASFDKTSQSFANQRAQRDAENRAAREVAEQLRMAIASDLDAS
jgi:LPS-assembly lipoprotein